MRCSYVLPMRWKVIYEYEVPEGALNLSSTKLPRPWSPWKSPPSRKIPHSRAGNWTRDLIFLSKKLWSLDQEAGRNLVSKLQDISVFIALAEREHIECFITFSSRNMCRARSSYQTHVQGACCIAAMLFLSSKYSWCYALANISRYFPQGLDATRASREATSLPRRYSVPLGEYIPTFRKPSYYVYLQGWVVLDEVCLINLISAKQTIKDE
jgi:hypothetical protein